MDTTVTPEQRAAVTMAEGAAFTVAARELHWREAAAAAETAAALCCMSAPVLLRYPARC
jgi:hypothetical protein